MVARKSAPKKSPEDRIVDAMFELAAEGGWRDLALADIAARAKVKLPELARLFSVKTGILAAWSRRIDAEVLAAAEAEDMSAEAPRDRLFDVLMLRFDAMAPYKPALRNIARDIARDPVSAASLWRTGVQSLGWMMEAAGIDASGLAGALKLRGLALVWGAAFRVWLEDGEDQSKTMAELDRRLRQGEDLMEAAARFRDRSRGAAA